MQKTYQQAIDYMSQGNPVLAEEKIIVILNAYPNNARCLRLLGQCLIVQNKIHEAIVTFQKLLQFHPDSIIAHTELAQAYIAHKNLEAAEEILVKALKLNPNKQHTLIMLGNISMKNRQPDKANRYFDLAESNDPFETVLVEIFQSMKNRNYAQAEQLCNQILLKDNNHGAALLVLSNLATQTGNYEEAVKILIQGLNYSPFNIKLLHSLIKSYSAMAYYDNAIEAVKRILEIKPSSAPFWILLAGELAKMGRYVESISAYQKAIKLAPEIIQSHLFIGHVYRIIGEYDSCIEEYKKALMSTEMQGAGYLALSDIKSYHFNQDEITQMTLYFNNTKHDKEHRSKVAFALGKAYEDEKNYDISFNYYEKANNLQENAHYRNNETNNTTKHICSSYPLENINIQAAIHNETTPIFIVGLPRSGSTLIEQILASHSEIEATMELFQIPNLVRRINVKMGEKDIFKSPGSINQFNKAELTELGQRYLDETKIFRTNKPFFIDKLPQNYQHIGLIHKILPQAIIIDARRHPMSGGFSAFKQHFNSGHEFSCNLENIGHYYNNYLAVMDYWKKILPKNKILTIQYEELVDSTEKQIHMMLEHCGVKFEKQCLQFYDDKRAINTPSSEQVRQPIYKKSKGQWHYFEEFLEPLSSALGEKTLSRFSQWS